MDLELLPEYRAHSPTLRPDWRWQVAMDAAFGDGPPARRPADPALDDALGYAAALWGPGADPHDPAPRRRWPDLDKAYNLRCAGGPPRWELEARLLAGQDDAEVAAACGLSPAVVDMYHSVFFHVRDRLGAHDWVLNRAVRDPWAATDPDARLGVCWRLVGYFAGVRMLELVIAVSLDRPLPEWATGRDCRARAGSDERLRRSVSLMLAAMRLPADVDPATLAELAAGAAAVPAPPADEVGTVARGAAGAVAETGVVPPGPEKPAATA